MIRRDGPPIVTFRAWRLVYLVALTAAAVVFYGWGAGAIVILATCDVEV